MPTYDVKLELTDEEGLVKLLTGQLSDSSTPPPQPSNGYNFTSNFNAAPLGPLTTDNKHLVWPDPAILSISEADANGALWSIVTGGKNGGQCARAFYQKGKVGEQGFYRLNLPPGKGAVSMEWDWLFESPFDMAGGPGKIGPFIVWGPRSGPMGINTPICWESKITTQPKRWTCAVQSGAGTGPYGNGQFVQNWYTPTNIAFDRWYHWKIEMLGGPGSYARYWLDGVDLNVPVHDFSSVTNANDTIAIEFGFWEGGAQAATYDCWARQDNVHIWTS